MLKSQTLLSYLFFAILVFASCGRPASPKNGAVNVDHIHLEPIRIERFDRALDSLTPTNALEKHRDWKSTYGQFYKDFIERILKLGPENEDFAIAAALTQIASSPDFRALKEEVRSVFSEDLGEPQRELEDAFRRVRYYLPEAVPPEKYVAFFSGFAVQIPIGEDYTGIGLDLFLGAESAFYPAIVDKYPRYISRRFTPQHLVPTLVTSYLSDEVVGVEDPDGKVLDLMLHYGKLMYFTDLCLPSTPDSLKIGYTEKQMAWAQHFEASIWDWFVSEQLLYKRGRSYYQKYFGEAPFTPELGERNESAPKLGIFIGWQLVRKYMDRHPDTSLPELLAFRDSQSFLEASRYRGR